MTGQARGRFPAREDPSSKTIEDLTDELSFLFAETGGKYRALEKPPAKKAA